MFILKDVQQIVEDNYADDIYNSVANYINNLTGGEFQDIFENTIDFGVCEGIGDMNVISYDVKEFDGQIEITGEIEVESEITGYVHWDGEDVELDRITAILTITFSLYYNKGKYEDFEIIDIYL